MLPLSPPKGTQKRKTAVFCVKSAIHVRCKKFACARESVDEKRPVQCVASTTDAAIAAVESLIWRDCVNKCLNKFGQNVEK